MQVINMETGEIIDVAGFKRRQNRVAKRNVPRKRHYLRAKLIRHFTPIAIALLILVAAVVSR